MARYGSRPGWLSSYPPLSPTLPSLSSIVPLSDIGPINWLMFALCIIITCTFGGAGQSSELGHAYGVSVMSVMCVP